MATRNHTKGELLAQLEQQRIQNQLLAANLRDEESRHRECREELAYTQNHLGEARALLESNQLNLELANERIRELTEERDEARFEKSTADEQPRLGELLAKVGKQAAERAASVPNLYRHARSRALFRSGFVTRFRAEPTTADYREWENARAVGQ